MLVSSFNLSQSYNYTPHLFYKKRFKTEFVSVYGPLVLILVEHSFECIFALCLLHLVLSAITAFPYSHCEAVFPNVCPDSGVLSMYRYLLVCPPFSI